MKPAFCANCVEDRDDLAPVKQPSGATAWVCEDCQDPVLALRIHEIRDQEASPVPSVGTGLQRCRQGGWM